MSGHGMPEKFAAPRDCEHNWQPVSMSFETQLLDSEGRVRVRQPDLLDGRCYFVCMGCACHTYMSTQWLGVRMYGSEDAIPDYYDRVAGRVIRHDNGYGRPAWELPPDPNDEDPDLRVTIQAALLGEHLGSHGPDVSIIADLVVAALDKEFQITPKEK